MRPANEPTRVTPPRRVAEELPCGSESNPPCVLNDEAEQDRAGAEGADDLEQGAHAAVECDRARNALSPIVELSSSSVATVVGQFERRCEIPSTVIRPRRGEAARSPRRSGRASIAGEANVVVNAEDEDVRGAKTQSLYRDVNERIRDVNASFNVVLPQGAWFCECADAACEKRIVLTPEDYESIRASGVRFAVAPDHVYLNIENVVERGDGYWIVEMYGAAGALAAKFDPRVRLPVGSS
jgi:hypothetical protein